jgi:hypothetical protein
VVGKYYPHPLGYFLILLIIFFVGKAGYGNVDGPEGYNAK